MKRFCRLLSLASAFAAILFVGPAFAAGECSSLMSAYNADNVTLYAGQLNSCAGQTFKPMGVIYTTTATAGTTVATTETTLATYTLPGGSLDVAGRKLRIKVSFSAAANANNKTFKLYFGSEVISSGVLTSNGVNGSAEMVVTKSGTNTQIVYANMLVATTSITGYALASAAETDTAGIVIKFTGTDGTASANDIVMNDFSVEYMN